MVKRKEKEMIEYIVHPKDSMVAITVKATTFFQEDGFINFYSKNGRVATFYQPSAVYQKVNYGET
jgi:hypothetical protein